jgi:hypothetical protein
MFFFLKIKKYFGYFSQKSINFAKNTGELIIFQIFTFFCLGYRKFIGFAVIFSKFWQHCGEKSHKGDAK